MPRQFSQPLPVTSAIMAVAVPACPKIKMWNVKNKHETKRFIKPVPERNDHVRNPKGDNPSLPRCYLKQIWRSSVSFRSSIILLEKLLFLPISFKMAASLKGLDPDLRKYLRINKLPDIYEVIYMTI